MKKMWLVARREYLYNLKRPLISVCRIWCPAFHLCRVGRRLFWSCPTVKITWAKIANLAMSINAGVLAEPVPLKDKPDEFIAFADDAAARAGIGFQNGQCLFCACPTDYMQTGIVQSYSYDSISATLKDDLDAFLLANLSRGLQNKFPLERIQDPVTLTIRPVRFGPQPDRSQFTRA